MPKRTRDGPPLKRSALVCKYFFLYQNRGHACERACDHIHLWLRFSSRARRRLFRRLVILCGIMQNCWATCAGSFRSCSLFFSLLPFCCLLLRYIPVPLTRIFVPFPFYAYLFMCISFHLLFLSAHDTHTPFIFPCLLSPKENSETLCYIFYVENSHSCDLVASNLEVASCLQTRELLWG